MPEQQENERLQVVLRRIEEVRRTNAAKLDLSGLGITSIPASVFDLPQLQNLDLSNNQITTVPASLWQLSHLQNLDLHDNQITTIPASLWQLPHLQNLDLHDNQITTVPDSLGQLSQLQHLDLRDNQITRVPDSLGQLSQLQHLDLRDNQITRVPDLLGQLSRLQRLYLANNQITRVPDSLRWLFQLEYLDLSNNQITTFPPHSGQLSRLQRLYLSNNQIAAVPDSLGQLSRLQRLYLGNNQIAAVPDSLGQLSQLQYLGLNSNKITAVPRSIGQLSRLQDLHLSSNQITAVPGFFGELSELQTLDLRNNRLTTISEELARLKKLVRLFLHGNSGLGLPEEIFGPIAEEVYSRQKEPKPPLEILAYLAKAADSRPLNEAKLILVGHGEVGKTSLVKTLTTGKFKKGEKTTEGIKISDWECQLDKKSKATVHIWDFGGQEMMHATHQFFLTQRSLYLLVLNRRQGRADREADYWFRLIRAFGGKDAPVIVVLNKQKAEPFDVNREGWLEKYKGNIKGFVLTDCEDKKSITQLKREIVKELQAMESLKARFPRRWFAIKDALSTMSAEHISFDDYRKLCQKLGESDPASQTSLAGFLHDLGIALNYGQDPRLRFNYVLNPEWVTQGIYALLHAFVRQKGVFTHAEAEIMLARSNYSEGDTNFILGLMERFELSFPLDEKLRRILIPELLDDQQPKDASGFKPEECLNFGYKYPVLAEGLLPRFIARTHHLGRPETRWKSGVILEDLASGSKALVKADSADAVVRVHIDGPRENRRELLGIIRYNFDVIHSDYEFKPEPLVYPPAAPREALSVKKLEVLARTKTTVNVVLPDDTSIEQNIAALIDSVAPSLAPLKLFLSYSHLEESSINELRKDLSIMERNGLIRPWYDRALTAGKQWEPSILNELNAADIVVCQLSREYLFSKNCLAELNAAIERNNTGEAVLAAYVLTDCGWREFRGLSKLEVLPMDGTPLLDWPDRHRYWRAVIDGIQKAIKRFQVEKKSRPGRAGMEN
jgi:internalin A